MDNKQLEQGSPQWLELRKTKIGGSDISCINGTNPWKSEYVLWLEKTGRKDGDPTNKAMEHGKLMEPLARKHYNDETGNNVIPMVCFYEGWDIAMASLDGISEDGSLIFETKSPMNPKLYDNAVQLKIPDYYLDQMQWCMGVSGATVCDYQVYLTGAESKIITVPFDKNHFHGLLTKARAFWIHVETDLAPKKKEDEDEYIDDHISNELASEWRTWKEKENEACDKRKAIEEQLKTLHAKQKCYFPLAEVKLNWIKGRETTDWKEVCSNFDIFDEDLEKYRKKSSGYSTFKIVG